MKKLLKKLNLEKEDIIAIIVIATVAIIATITIFQFFTVKTNTDTKSCVGGIIQFCHTK